MKAKPNSKPMPKKSAKLTASAAKSIMAKASSVMSGKGSSAGAAY